MRRTPLSRLTRAVPALALLLTSPVLAACSGDPEDPGDSPTSAASAIDASSGAGSEDATDEGTEDGTGSTDTYADVAEPATLEVPLGELDGFEELRVWEGTDLDEGPSQVIGGLDLGGGDEAGIAITSEPGELSRGSSEAEMAYWLKHSNLVDEPPSEVDPVVVDGVELLRAQGVNSFATVDHVVRTTADVSIAIDFVLPLALSPEEREELIGQVLATVVLDPALD